MGKFKPLIGITAWYDYTKGDTYLKKGYIEAVNRAGGVSMLIPATEDYDIVLEIIRRCDGFLLSGGGDIDAKHFGEINLPCNGELSPLRDEMEIMISREAVSRSKPLFGICRGMQIMNVALGGSIYQDIFCQIKDRQLVKHQQDAPKWYPIHKVDVEEDSALFRITGRKQLEVNSYHHQAVKDVAEGFRVTAKAEDGVIEAIEHTLSRFALGVQWHPELMIDRNAEMFGLFEAFIEACVLDDLRPQH
jgi:putative glutamine amidotransferase